jgi:hypothetical protein
MKGAAMGQLTTEPILHYHFEFISIENNFSKMPHRITKSHISVMACLNQKFNPVIREIMQRCHDIPKPKKTAAID